MKLRHITALFLAIVMLLMTLTACFGELTTGAETTTDETPSTTTGKVPGTTKPTPGTTKPTPDTTKPPQSGETPENGDWLTGYLEKMPTFTINTENNAPIVSKEIYLNGEITLTEAVEQVQKNTRHYAKRQLTWFRRYDKIYWYDITEHGGGNQAVSEFIQWLREKL